jgi:hypothetical protein
VQLLFHQSSNRSTAVLFWRPLILKNEKYNFSLRPLWHRTNRTSIASSTMARKSKEFDIVRKILLSIPPALHSNWLSIGFSSFCRSFAENGLDGPQQNSFCLKIGVRWQWIFNGCRLSHWLISMSIHSLNYNEQMDIKSTRWESLKTAKWLQRTTSK